MSAPPAARAGLDETARAGAARCHYLVVGASGIGAGLVAAGVFLPWLTFYAGLVALSGAGSRNGDLLLTAAAAAAVAVATLAVAGVRRPRLAGLGRWSLTLLGALLVGFCGYLLIDVHRAVGGGGGMLLAHSGPGLEVSLAGALLVFATTFLPGDTAGRAPRQRIRVRHLLRAAIAAGRGSATSDRLRVALGTVWLLDAALQFQPFMFGSGFTAQVLHPAARVSPLPTGWAVQLIASHPALCNEVFAVTQLLLGVGILLRRTARQALAASIVWAAGVWWIGEGFGGLFARGANPVAGAPGAALLYGIIAGLLLLHRHRPRLAGRLAAASVAGLAVMSAVELFPSRSTANNVAGMVRGMAGGEPGWLAGFDRGLAHLVVQHPVGVLGGYAALWGLVATVAAILLADGPASRTRVLARARDVVRSSSRSRSGVHTMALAALAVSSFAAVAPLSLAQAFGGIAAGSATDVNSAPLVLLLAGCCWLGLTRGAVATGRVGAPGSSRKVAAAVRRHSYIKALPASGQGAAGG